MLIRTAYIFFGLVMGLCTIPLLIDFNNEADWVAAKELAAESARRGCMMTKVEHGCDMSDTGNSWQECTRIGKEVLEDLNGIKEKNNSEVDL